MFRLLSLTVPSLAVALLASAPAGWMATQRKLDLIQKDRLRPGSRVVFPAAELNAWVGYEADRNFPGAVRNPVVELGTETVTGTALIDFGKLRRGQGNPPSPIFARLLAGERPVRVVAALHSERGTATVDVRSVQISGITLSGSVLDFLISEYVLPNYPGARIGEPFALSHHIERIDVRPGAVNVLIGH
jgi:hypothetical protein